MIAALVTVPLLIRGLGNERFGILTVGWVVIGYFGLFDFGLGRALTKLVAERLASSDQDGVGELIWTAIFLTFLLGVVGAAILALVTPTLVHQALKISPGLEQEAIRAFELLALSLPLVISTAGFLGVLEASQSFGVVNALRVPMGLFNYIGPLLVLPFSHSLVPVVALLVVGRLVGWIAYLIACLRVFPVLRKRVRLDWGQVVTLARFGGWMTVSNLVSPLMTHLDRFLIGALVSMAAVAYYTTPYELITRLWLVPSALMGVFFPAFAASFVQDRRHTAQLLDRGVRAIFLVLFPAALLAVTFAHDGMLLWLGKEYALRSTGVLQWLALGVFINCLAQVPFSLIQGIGRPDITGKLHLLELPVYVMSIWFFSREFGIEGVAMAWVLRVVVDTTILFAVSERLLPKSGVFPRAVAMMVTAAAVFGVASQQHGLAAKSVFLVVVLGIFGVFAWLRLLSSAERAFVRGRFASPLSTSEGSPPASA
jgi:O-antigen/teichoic acid export membrane protein